MSARIIWPDAPYFFFRWQQSPQQNFDKSFFHLIRINGKQYLSRHDFLENHIEEKHAHEGAGRALGIEAADFARFLGFLKKQCQTFQNPGGTAFQDGFRLPGMAGSLREKDGDQIPAFFQQPPDPAGEIADALFEGRPAVGAGGLDMGKGGIPADHLREEFLLIAEMAEQGHLIDPGLAGDGLGGGPGVAVPAEDLEGGFQDTVVRREWFHGGSSGLM